MLEYIGKHQKESGIIYCLSRRTVEHIAKRLQDHGIKAFPYHAGLSDQIRKQNQERFIHEDIDIIVATIAFGMGIDKPNVRYVIHYDLPKTIEHYYQETGRAGRDGLASKCIFLFSYGDKFVHERFIQEKESKEEQRIASAQLQAVIDYTQSKVCRRSQLLNYFSEEYPKDNCKFCDNCLLPRPTFDATILAQKILSISESLRLFQEGKSPYQIASVRGYSEKTIISHLQQAYLKEANIDITLFVPPSRQQNIIDAFSELGLDYLAPIKEKLGDDYSYEELRWIQVKLRREKVT